MGAIFPYLSSYDNRNLGALIAYSKYKKNVLLPIDLIATNKSTATVFLKVTVKSDENTQYVLRGFLRSNMSDCYTAQKRMRSFPVRAPNLSMQFRIYSR